ncbi:MAG TPA: efflux RND transporter permease subunit [Candidatus Saccharimonadales bacterium]
MKNPLKKVYRKDGQDRLLPRFSLFIFDRYRVAAMLWLGLTVFGIVSYTTLLKREGFPSINIPYTIVSGTYFANDPAKVDRQVAKPISDIILADSRVKTVQTNAQGKFYSVVVQYKEQSANATKIGKELEQRIKNADVLPAQASMKFESPRMGFSERGDDGIISVYSENKNVSSDELAAQAEDVVNFIKSKHLPEIATISTINTNLEGTDLSGQQAISRAKFDRYAVRKYNQNVFYNSVSIGYFQKSNTDIVKLDEKLENVLAEYRKQNEAKPSIKVVISATYANDIKDQIGELQKSLLEGLLIVLVVGSLVIAIRASIITVISMATVIALTLGVLWALCYTLNTITLFSLILGLSLIVDDTIIMVEAIDAQRRRLKDPRQTIKVATQKVSRAMVAATLTACLSFAPLLFVGGILGGFIRAIPVTIIASLLISLLVALVFIPLFARYLLLGKKQMGADSSEEPAAKIEARVAALVGAPMLWARNSKKKLIGVGLTAMVIGFLFVGAGGYIFQKVTFNIFPPSKDSNGLNVNMNFPSGATIEQAEEAADRADDIIADTLGKNFESASYYTNTSSQDANLTVYLLSYSKRNVRAPELQDQLNKKFETFTDARVSVTQADMGPPASAFSVRLETEDRAAAFRLAGDISGFLKEKKLVRASGQEAKVKELTVSNKGTYSRYDGKLNISVEASFQDTDTSTLVSLAQSAVKKEFDEKKLQGYGLNKDVLQFDLGQEEDNQDSFMALMLAFPILLFVIYILLAVQFRSLAQPLLIFMAIPFSLFGISLGLYATDNPFSFFAMLGFFALVGLSIKNTILLTDYANQLRRSGESAVDAAVGALKERFRPLLATSLTATLSLIPLAISSPFWEGLAVVLICGLLSSTFLVITIFPYYYLGAEFVRLRVSRKACLLWLALTIAVSTALIYAGANAAIIPLVAIVLAIAMKFAARLTSRSRKA